MILVDSHLHFDAFEAEGAVDALLARARDAGVQWMIAIGGSDTANALAVRLAASHPDCLRAAVGYDRDLAAGAWRLESMASCLDAPFVVAVGETGLDYHYEPGTAPEQRRLFGAMLDLARRHRKPVVVHSREAEDDTLAMLREHAAGWGGDASAIGVVHCFTGSLPFALRLAELGYFISFSGILSFRNADTLREVARALPLDRILIETDAPYLAPVPHRGRRNEPAYVAEVARALAQARGDVGPDEAAVITARNAVRLFGLPNLAGTD